MSHVHVECVASPPLLPLPLWQLHYCRHPQEASPFPLSITTMTTTVVAAAALPFPLPSLICSRYVSRHLLSLISLLILPKHPVNELTNMRSVPACLGMVGRGYALTNPAPHTPAAAATPTEDAPPALPTRALAAAATTTGTHAACACVGAVPPFFFAALFHRYRPSGHQVTSPTRTTPNGWCKTM